MVRNAHIGPLKQNTKASYDDVDKRLIGLDVKAGAAIGKSIPYHVYQLVHNCESAQDMMETLMVA